MRRGGEAQDQIERETLPSLIQTGDSFLFRFHLGLQGASQKPKTKDEALHPVPQEITKRELLDRMSWKKGSRQKKEITKRGLLNRMSWKKGGVAEQSYDVKGP